MSSWERFQPPRTDIRFKQRIPVFLIGAGPVTSQRFFSIAVPLSLLFFHRDETLLSEDYLSDSNNQTGQGHKKKWKDVCRRKWKQESHKHWILFDILTMFYVLESAKYQMLSSFTVWTGFEYHKILFNRNNYGQNEIRWCCLFYFCTRFTKQIALITKEQFLPRIPGGAFSWMASILIAYFVSDCLVFKGSKKTGNYQEGMVYSPSPSAFWLHL